MNLYIMFGANWLFFDRDLCTYFALRLSSSKLFTSQFKIVRETFWNAAMHHASNMRNKPRGTVFKSDRWYFSLIKRKDWNDNLIYYNCRATMCLCTGVQNLRVLIRLLKPTKWYHYRRLNIFENRLSTQNLVRKKFLPTSYEKLAFRQRFARLHRHRY